MLVSFHRNLLYIFLMKVLPTVLASLAKSNETLNYHFEIKIVSFAENLSVAQNPVDVNMAKIEYHNMNFFGSVSEPMLLRPKNTIFIWKQTTWHFKRV